MLWFFSDAIANDPSNWWNPFIAEGFATIILQWGIALAILIKLNDWLNRQVLIEPEVGEDELIEVAPEY